MLRNLIILTSLFLITTNFLFSQCNGVSVSLGADQFYCSGISTTLTATVTGTPSGTVTYSWTYQGNTIANVSTNNHTVQLNQPGTYGVIMNYGTGCSDTDLVVIGYLSPGSIGSNQLICNNGNPNLLTNVTSASIASPATIQYQWQSSIDNSTWTNISGAISDTFDPPIISQDTYYRRVASILNNNNIVCSNNSNIVFVDVLTTFSIDAGNNINTCVGQNIAVNPTINGINGYSPQYSWSGPNGFSSTNSSLTLNNIQQSSSGQYTLSAIIGACTLQDQVTIDVLGFSITSVFFNSNNTQLVACLGSQQANGDVGFNITLPNLLSNIQSISVNWGDGNNNLIPSTSYSSIQIHNYLPGSYSLSVTLTSTNGCAQTINYPVFVGSSPSPAALQLFINQANGCVPHSTDYTFSVPSTNVNGTTYTVTWGDGTPNQVYTHPNVPTTLSHIYSTSSCGYNVTISNTTYNNVFQPSVITQNPCSVQPQPSAAGLISVGLPPDASFTTSRTTICPNGSIQFTNTSNFGLTIPTASGASCINTAPYYWIITPNNISGNNWTLLNGSILGSNNNSNNQFLWSIGSMNPTVQFNTPGIYTIELRVKNPCGMDSYTQTICVISPPTSSINSYSTIQCSPATTNLSSNSTLPMCGNSAVPVAYSWSVTNPTNCTSCSSSIATPNAANSNFTFTNNSNSIQTYTVNLNVTPLDPITNLPLSNPSCANSSSISVQVYPSVQLNSINTCNGNLNWNLNNQVNVPSSFTWQATANSNVSGETSTLQNTSSITDNLVNTSTSSQTVTYTINATSTIGGCLASNNFTVNLVTPLSIQSLSNQSICVGVGLSAPLVLNYTGGSGTPTYTWQLNSNTTSIANTSSYSPAVFTNAGTYIYTGTVSLGPTGCVQTVSQQATITVAADPTVTGPAGASYCLNASSVTPLSVSASGGNGGSYSYQWYNGSTPISGATSSSYTPPVSATGSTNYNCLVSILPASSGCSVTSTSAAITVNPAPTILTQPISQTVCIDGTLNNLSVAYSGGSGTATHQWYSNTSASNSGGTPISGATGPSFTLPSGLSSTVNTSYYYCTVNFNSSNGCSLITSDVATITIVNDPIISGPSLAQTICNGGTASSISVIPSGGVSSNYLYQWYSNSSNSNTGGTLITTNGNSATYNPPTSNAYYYCTISILPTATGCITNSTPSQVTVVADPTVSSPIGASYCQNASPVTALSVTATGGNGGSYSYQWYNGTTAISGANTSTYTPPVSATGSTNYNCIVSILPSSSGCSVTSTNAAIVVNSAPTISTQPISQTVCIDGTLNNLSVAYSGGSGTATHQWYSNTSATNTGGTPISGATGPSFTLPSGLSSTANTSYYYCTVSFDSNNGCSLITSNAATIAVLADPVFSLQPITGQSICNGGSLNVPLSVTVNGGSGTPTYQWYTVNGTTYSPIASSNSNSYNPPTFSTNGTYNYAVLVTQSVSGCASTYSTNAAVVVVADPIITDPDGASYCQNASPVTTLSVTASGGISSNYSYQWYNGTTSISGANASTYTPSVSATGTINYNCIVSILPASTGCSVTSTSAAITVNPAPTFTTQPISQTICIGGTLNNLSIAYSGGSGSPTYQWYSNTSATNTGGTAISGASGASYTLPTGLSSTANTSYYYCTVSFDSNNGCSLITSNAATIAVLPDPVFSLQPITSQSICNGGSLNVPLTVTVNGGSGTPTYQWYTVNGTTYSSIPSSNSNSYNPPTFSTNGTYNYAVLVTQSVSGCASTYSTNAEVVVVDDPTVSSPIGASYCQNASPVTTLSVTASGGISSNYSYQWYNGSTAISGANASTYTPPVSATGTTNYNCIVSILPASTGCLVTSGNAAIVVNPAPTISTQPISQTVCIDGTLNNLSIAYSGGSGTPTYQWYTNTSATNTGGTAISGASGASYTLPTGLSSTANTSYYYCTVSFDSNNGCSLITSNAATIAVLPDPVFSLQPITSQSICNGGSLNVPLSVTVNGGSGTPTYQWYTVNGTTYSSILSSNSNSYNPPTFSTNGTYNYAVLVTQSVSGCASTYSTNAEVVVVDDPTVSSPIGASYCQNASPVTTLSVTASGGISSNYSYQWYNGSTAISGANASTYTPPVSATGTTNYNCIVSILPASTGCSVTSTSAAITVNPAPAISTQPISQTVCIDGTLNNLSIAYSGGSGTPTYQWYTNTSATNTGGTAISGASGASYTLPTGLSSTANTSYYYCTVSFDSNNGCSLITSDAATISVLPDPVFSLQPITSQTICNGGSLNVPLTVTVSGGSGTPTYQWYTVNGTTYSPIASSNSNSYNPPTFSTNGTYNYAVLVTQSVSGCASTYSTNAAVVVVADPIITDPDGASYCQNASPVAPLSVTASGGNGGSYSYQWYNGSTSINGANASTYSPPVNVIGTTNYNCIVSILPASTGCSVTSTSAAITVNPAPTFTTQPISQTICIGGTFNSLSVAYENGTGVPSYQWYSNSTNSYLGATLISGAITPNYLPSASAIGTSYYFCEINFSYGGCSAISSAITSQNVVGDPIISSEPLANQTICVGGTIPVNLSVTVSGGTGTTSYQWSLGSNQIPTAIQNTFTPSSFTTAGTYNYSVTISSTGVGCDVLNSQSALISVINDPIVSAPTPATYCQNSPVVTPISVTVSGGLGTTNYQWYSTNNNTTSGGSPISGAINSSFVPSVSNVGTTYYYCEIIQNTPNCATTSTNAFIQVNTPPTISTQPLNTQTLCEGGTPTTLQIGYVNGTNSATYQWYVNATNSTIGGMPLINDTTANYIPPTNLVNTRYYYCVITFQQGGCSSLTSTIAQVTIVNDPSITLQPLTSQAICQGNQLLNPLTFNYTGGTGTPSISWYLNTTPPILMNGITTNSFMPSTFNVADTFEYFATLVYSGIGCNSVSTQPASIIVHPTPYALNLNDTVVVCNHGELAVPLTASVNSTFVWHTSNTTSVNGESFLNQTSYTINDSLSNLTTTPQFLTYTVTPTSFPYGCVGPDSILTVQLQPDVILSMNPSIEICSGSPVNGIITSNIPANFNWFVSIDNPNVTGESITQSTNWLINDVLVNTSTANQVVVYSVFPVSIEGNCPGNAQPLVVTVKPPIDLLNQDTITICSGQNVGINLVANTNVQFNWYASPSTTVLNETTTVVSSSQINDLLVNNTNQVQVVTYNVIGTSGANGCSSPILPLYVVVNPIPSIINATPVTICNGNYLYPISIQPSVTGATSDWNVLINNIGIPSSFGSNTIPGFIATNNSIVTQTGQISIVPTYTNNNVTCIGNDTTLFIPVLPTPTANQITDIVACNQVQVPLTPVTGTVPNTLYQWLNSSTSVGLNTSGIGNLPIFVGQNNGTVPISSTVSVSPSYTQNNVTCQGTPIDFTITINPSPILLNSGIEICDREYTNILLNANISSSFIWNAEINQNVYNETANPIQNTAYINDNLVLAGNTVETVIYHVTPISTPYGCSGNDTTINVQINPLPIVDFTVITPILCNQAQINFQNNSIGSLSYLWTFGDGDSSFLFNPVHSYDNFGTYNVNLTAIDQLTGCQNQSTEQLIIHESPEANFTLSDSLACGSLNVTFNALDLNTNWSYLWDFGDGSTSTQYGIAGNLFQSNGCFDIGLTITTPDGCVSNTIQNGAVCIYPEPVAAFSMNNTVISSLNPEVIFYNSSVNADNYYWNFGDNTSSIVEEPVHSYSDEPATYTIILTASNQIGCIDTAIMNVTVFQDLTIYVPNTFTPNQDEYNNVFLPILTEGFKKDSYHLTIYNRWGEIVFESYDSEVGWDGSYYGIPSRRFIFPSDRKSTQEICQDGTYTWLIEIQELQSAEVRKFIGHVNLLGRAR